MTKPEGSRPLRDFAVAVLFCALLPAASGAAAQGQEIVYSVDQWPKMSTRLDAKLGALAVSLGTQWPRAGPRAAGPATADDIVLTIPVGEAVALWWRAAANQRHLTWVLIELSAVTPKPGPRAPFAVRLSEVVVTSVQVSKPKGDSGPGVAEVKLQARTFEIFTAKQDPTGAVKPGQEFKWDYLKNSE